MNRIQIVFDYISQAPDMNFPQTLQVIVTGREDDLQAMAAEAKRIGARVTVGEFRDLRIRSIELLPEQGRPTHG